MAINVVEWVWQFSKAAGTAKLVLLAVADHADDTGENAFPSIRRLCHRTGLSERTIHAATRELVKLGELVVARHGGRAGCNLYRVIMLPGATAVPQDLRGEAQDLRVHPRDLHPAGPAVPTAGSAPRTAGSAVATAGTAPVRLAEQPQDLRPSTAGSAVAPPQDLRGEPSLNRPLSALEAAEPVPAPGDGLSDDEWLAALVAELRWLRPDWREVTIGYALKPPFVARHSRAEIRQAFVALTRDTDAKSPGAAAFDGPVWHTTLDLPAYQPWCRGCDMANSRQVRGGPSGEVVPCPACHPTQSASTREVVTA